MSSHARRALAAIVFMCLVGSLVPTQALLAQCPTLTATVRDFNDSHPDFESVGGFDPGIVLPDLGADRKPVYAGQSGNPTTHGAEAFNQWYNDVPGVNMTTTIPLPLSATSTPGVCRFSDGSFFPIDGQLFGNQGRAHNYHFTLELHASFVYNGGETFSFTGDDDLWVFLNRKLAIDLGGVHGPMTATISLDAIASELGLVQGNRYDFDLFFAERHTVGSSFTMETSIQLEGDEPPPPPDTCPRSQGYWKNHAAAWPVDELMLGEHTYSQSELLAMLRTPVRGDASVILAKQLIAAKLNLANGAPDSDISDDIAEADVLIGSRHMPIVPKVTPSTEEGGTMVEIADLLDRYNNGVFTLGCGRAALRSPVAEDLALIELGSSSPNPFDREAVIELRLAAAMSARVEVVDVQGRRVRVLAAGEMSAGDHAVVWDGRDDGGALVRPGVYYYRVSGAGQVAQKKIVFLR